MYYYGYRWYDPNLQRWPNRDPVEEIGSMMVRYTHVRSENNAAFFPFAHERLHQVEKENEPLYVFVRSNPVSFTDHLGLDCPGCDSVPDIFESPAVLECCAEHDRCYDEHNCNARSWLQIICPILISTAATPNCEFCNVQVAACMAVTRGRGDDPTRPNYYCAVHHVFFNDPASPHMHHCTR